MRTGRRPTPAEIEDIAVVRDAQVATTLASVAIALNSDIDVADGLLGGAELAARLRARRAALVGLLRKEETT